MRMMWIKGISREEPLELLELPILLERQKRKLTNLPVAFLGSWLGQFLHDLLLGSFFVFLQQPLPTIIS